MTAGRAWPAVVVAAGGTGGHLFPAQALAEELRRRGHGIRLMTDERGAAHGASFPADGIHVIGSATVTPRRPWLLPGQSLRLLNGLMAARRLLKVIAPGAVVGFGGYPSVPPLLSASLAGIPTCLHEQNAVMGRANRALARRAGCIASSFPKMANLPDGLTVRVVVTGNPVRDAVLAAAQGDYRAPSADGPFRVLVVGGSQGAHVFADVMPRVVQALPHEVRNGLSVTQQCRREDIGSVAEAYRGLGFEAELAPFFDDLPQRIADAHLVVARSGASTIAELAVIGRPAILVPLPHALENDQLRNAESFSGAGAGWLFRQDEMEPDAVALFLTRLRYHSQDLSAAAAAAKAFGRPDAAARLADAVEAAMRASQVAQPGAPAGEETR